RIGSLYGVPVIEGEKEEEYRRRLKITILELLEGTGTNESVRRVVKATVGIDPEIVENPPRLISGRERLLKNRETWREVNNSINKETPTIIIRASGGDVISPTVLNMSTGEYMTFKGTIFDGDQLVVYPDGKAKLAGMDVSEFIKTLRGRMPTLPRKESIWRYSDITGQFDMSRFDECVLAASDSPVAIVQLKYYSHLPATFMVKLPWDFKQKVIDVEKDPRQHVQPLLEKIKAAGVQVIVNFGNEFQEKVYIKDELSVGTYIPIVEENQLGDSLSWDVVKRLEENALPREEFYACGVFNLTKFDSMNTFA
ncbi:MAG: hypothetical protein QW728_07925, partial [Thermoplasmata archaeon]